MIAQPPSPLRKPMPRTRCLDCRAGFARHRALQRSIETITNDLDQQTLVCPECGSQAVEEAPHEAR